MVPAITVYRINIRYVGNFIFIFLREKIAKITLWVIISIFILVTLFICFLAFGLYFISDD